MTKMENTEKKQTSRPVSLLLLIPALLFGLISIAMAVVGLGLIPLLPALIGLLLGGVSFLLFRNSYKVFTYIIFGIALIAALISITRVTLFESKVAADEAFDSTLIRTEEGIDADLKDLFEDSDFGDELPMDSISVE